MTDDNAARQVNAATSTCTKCGQAITDCSTNDGPCWHTDNSDDPICPVHDGVGDERWFHEAENASEQ